MEKDRSYKIIAIVALIIAIVGLSIGFAAFSTNLSIEPSAELNTVNKLKVEFSSSGSSEPEVENVAGAIVTGNPTVGNATIINSGAAPKITGLTAIFTQPGEAVSYTFYAVNTGEFDAYLKAITLGDKTCTPKAGSNPATNYDNVCDSIEVKVEVGNATADNRSAAFTGHKLQKGNYEEVTVTISYKTGQNNYADGDLTVNFEPITFTYSTVD